MKEVLFLCSNVIMKNQLRKLALQKRKELDVSALSEQVMCNLFSLDVYKNAKNILTYFPLKYEIQTQACFNDDSKIWYLPRVDGENLEVCLYEKEKLSKGSFNIQEPINEKIDMISRIINWSLDDNGFYNPIRVKIFTALEIMYSYTNLTFTAK